MVPGKAYYSEFNLISESGNIELIKMVYPSKKVSINFLNNRVDIGEIPLNLLTKVIQVIRNGNF